MRTKFDIYVFIEIYKRGFKSAGSVLLPKRLTYYC
jgi:hypothetical protein